MLQIFTSPPTSKTSAYQGEPSLRPEAEPPAPSSQAQPGNKILEALPRLGPVAEPPAPSSQAQPGNEILEALPRLSKCDSIWQTVLEDFRIIFERDPAARNWLEVLLCYPGFHAICLNRFAHWLYVRKVSVIPRLISHIGRLLTGIEIHPGATIGKGVFIDHGMGVVIGETAIVGDYALIYQGVTLGGTGKETGKRHPTLGKNVVVGAGAKVLGNISIGNNVRIGAGSIVLRGVPSDCTVVGVPGRIVSKQGIGCPLEHAQLPDTQASVIRSLWDRIEKLEQQLQDLRKETRLL